MSVKVRNKQNDRVATVTNVLGRALVRMGTHSYVVAQIEADPEPAAVSEQPDEATKPKRAYRRKDMRAE